MLKTCQFIKGMMINYDDEHRIVIINEQKLKFGYTSYTILSLLLAHPEVSDHILAQSIYQQATNQKCREQMRKNISKLRGRLRIHTLGIERIHDQGYRLVRHIENLA